MKDYKLVFTDEAQANDVIEQVTHDLHPSQFVLYVIGIHKRYEYDESNPEAEPTVTILSEGWHVDLRLREPNDLLDKYTVVVETPIHSFS